MQDSITMAEVGSMVKVSGSRIATPLGPPNPGSTPTKMPSTKPTIIRASVFHVSRTAKPCMSRPKASITRVLSIYLIAKGRFERSLRHDDVEGDVEGHEHHGGEHEGGQQRLPQRDLADHSHEGCDQEETCDIESEKLGSEAEQQRRHEHRHDTAQLRTRDKSLRGFLARQESGDEAIEAGGAEDDRQIERKITGLRAGRIPGGAAAPIVPSECQRQRQQQPRHEEN